MNFEAIKELFDIEDNSFGFREEDIKEAENRLQISFPSVLKEYYRKLGKHQKLNQAQNRLVSLDRLNFDEEGVLVFYVENQYAATWGIKKEDLDESNPKVYREDHTKFGKVWELDSSSLSVFFISMGFIQSIFVFDFHANICGVENKYDKIVTENYREVEYEFSFWGVKFYRNKSTQLISVFRNPNQTDIFVAAKNKLDFEEITKRFDFEWDYHSERDE